MEKRRGQVGYRFLVFIIGLLIMSLGIVFFIKSNLGATPWDVLHVGLFYRLGLSIGSWSIIMGILVLTTAALISKEIPHIGAFLNMILIGVFIDFYIALPFMKTPDSFFGQLAMFTAGMILSAYGMGIYISASLGTGPRDSLMMALNAKTGWKIKNVKAGIEIIVLIIGWRLGGPVNWGTILYCLVIGPLTGLALPQCYSLISFVLAKLPNKKNLLVTDENSKGDVSI